MLVRMRRRRAVVETCGRARQSEVPVRACGSPGRAAVEALEHFLEAEEDVIRVRRVDAEELVVPGLDTGVVAVRGVPERRAGVVLQVPPLGDLRPRTADAGIGLVDSLQDRPALVGAGMVEHSGRLDERVDVRAVRRVGDRRPAHVSLVQGAGDSDRAEVRAAVGRLVDAVAVRAGPPADDRIDDVAARVRLDRHVRDEGVVRNAARLRTGDRQRG